MQHYGTVIFVKWLPLKSTIKELIQHLLDKHVLGNISY